MCCAIFFQVPLDEFQARGLKTRICVNTLLLFTNTEKQHPGCFINILLYLLALKRRELMLCRSFSDACEVREGGGMVVHRSSLYIFFI